MVAGSRNWSSGSSEAGRSSATPSGMTRFTRLRSSSSDCGAPPEKGIQHQHAAAQTHAHEEVPGERDALDRQADAPAELHVEDRHRDRHAGTAIDHFIEIAVARVVVILGVAPVAELFVQKLVEQRHDAVFAGCRGREARAQPRRHPFDFADVALDVEVGIGVLRDQQARARGSMRASSREMSWAKGWRATPTIRPRGANGGRKPRPRHAPAIPHPRTTSPSTAGTLSCQLAASHQPAVP